MTKKQTAKFCHIEELLKIVLSAKSLFFQGFIPPGGNKRQSGYVMFGKIGGVRAYAYWAGFSPVSSFFTAA